jgi:hypothetical protein
LDGALHAFTLADLAERKLLSLAGGNVEIEEVPTPVRLSNAEGEADFPALAAGPAGRLAVAWQEYIRDRDRVVCREFDGQRWGPAEVLEAPETNDVFRPAAVYDATGALHLVWSAQVQGNWDLYARRKTAAGWQPVERLTQAAGPDFNHKLIADSTGDLWLAWQAFRGGQSDIFLKRFTAGEWGPEIQISESRANHWEPALAAAPGGAVWVGWDGYDQGNYDIYVRPVVGGAPGPVRQITRSPRFQAHVSLAAEPQGNLWIGFDEAEVNWGKDYGYLVKDRGNPLYQSRRLRLVRLSGDRLEEPATSLADAFPLGPPDFLQYPQLVVSPDGKLALTAMQLTFAHRVLEVWGTRGVWELAGLTLDGTGWKRHQILPQSVGPHEMRAAVASDGNRVWAAWAADSRAFGGPSAVGRLAVHAAPLLDAAASGPIRLKPFQEEPELALPTHPSEEANLRSVRNYRIASGGREYRILRGDLHRHTTLSEDGVGDGSLWDFYRYSFDAARMDFATVTDHQGGHTSYNWWKTQKSTDLFLVPGRITTLYAYERSVRYPNGHRNIVFPERGAPILPIPPEEQQGKVRSADAVWPYLRRYNALAFRHTIATDQGTDWKDHNNELEPLVEVYQGNRNNYEHEGAPKAATAEKLCLQRSGYQPAGFLWNALAKGYRMGIEAASDHVSTHISYSCILAEGDSRQALLGAMRQRHAFGATDNIVLDFRLQAGGKEYLQGDALTARSRYLLIANALGTGPIRRLDVIRNEQYIYAVTPVGQTTVKFTYTDPHPARGENRYYVRLQQEDGNLAWSSPVWVQVE